MKAAILCILLALVASQTCPAEKGFPETPSGELAYIDCEEGKWGYQSKFCSVSQTPIWIDITDICTPIKKLAIPPYGSHMVEYDIKIANFAKDTFTPEHKAMVDIALFNFTYEYVVKQVDVLVIDVKKVDEKENTLVLRIHQRMDFVYEKEVIELIKTICSDGELLFHLQELSDDFLDAKLTLDENSFTIRKFNIFENPWFNIIFYTTIVCLLWWFFCQLGRRCCCKEKKDPLVKNASV